jgi:hypothetical protein
MSSLNFDTNLVHSGLDSGALTMLGAVVRQFPEPGQYRGTVRQGKSIQRVFYLDVDENSAVAAADVDLAKLAKLGLAQTDAGRPSDDNDCRPEDEESRFSVNPRGYVAFRVSGGAGGYWVNLRRADPDEKTPVFNSTALADGDVFSAQILQPGTYWVTNSLRDSRAQLTVAYPPKAFSGYRPPDAIHVAVTERGFVPETIELQAAQGAVFDCRTEARIVITLERESNRAAEPDAASAV